MNWKKKDAVLILTVLLIAGAAFGAGATTGAEPIRSQRIKRLGSMAVRIYLR